MHCIYDQRISCLVGLLCFRKKGEWEEKERGPLPFLFCSVQVCEECGRLNTVNSKTIVHVLSKSDFVGVNVMGWEVNYHYWQGLIKICWSIVNCIVMTVMIWNPLFEDFVLFCWISSRLLLVFRGRLP